MHLHTFQSCGCWRGARFEPLIDDEKQTVAAPNSSVETLVMCWKLLDSMGFHFCM